MNSISAQRKCIEEGCNENAYNRGKRCIIHLDEYLRKIQYERNKRARLRKQNEKYNANLHQLQ